MTTAAPTDDDFYALLTILQQGKWATPKVLVRTIISAGFRRNHAQQPEEVKNVDDYKPARVRVRC